MADLFENPAGLDGFEFIEFSAPEKGQLEPVFEAMGFTKVARHRSKHVELWRQGGINLITNYEKGSPAYYFAKEHGASACGMGFRVRDAKAAYDHLLANDAEPCEVPTGPMELNLPAIRGIGHSLIYLIDRYDDGEGGLSIYDIDFEYLPGVEKFPEGAGFKRVDHLTHNVYKGRMKYWAEFYEKLFNFREIRYFDIKGEYTGLTSQALTAPDGKIRIPLNEEGEGGKGQIEEFLREYNGEGIQHIALTTANIYDTVERLRARGVRLQDTIETYYELVDQRVPGHGEDLERLKRNRILIDGNVGEEGILLQIFTETMFGPIFFEIIQRKGNEGFGNGNFQALYESIELDQIRRGVITVDE